jgi:putative transposase
MKEVLGWVNFGRLLPPKVGHYCTPIYIKTWNVKISMDGKGRFKDNIFIERLWRTLKYERIYLRVYETGSELAKDMTTWFPWYNERRPHTSLDKRTPNEAYFEGLEKLKAAA